MKLSAKFKEDEKMNELNNKMQWKIAFVVLVSLMLGIELARKIDDVLAPFFAANYYLGVGVYGISGIEGAIMVGLEMSLVPTLVIIAIAIAMKLPYKTIISIAWKVFVIGGFIGIIVGSTYSSGIQDFYCGYIQ
jgi:hypothetical protein